MNDFITYLKNKYGYSDYEIKLLGYYLKSLFFELSKFVLIGILFLFWGQFLEYLFAVAILLLIRTSLGGLHFKTYLGCFSFTLLFFITGAVLLPKICVNKIFMLIALFICIVINNLIGPITSCFRPTPNGALIKKCKKNATIHTFIYCLLIFIFPRNHYISIGFWVIVLQTIQLLFAYSLKRR